MSDSHLECVQKDVVAIFTAEKIFMFINLSIKACNPYYVGDYFRSGFAPRDNFFDPFEDGRI